VGLGHLQQGFLDAVGLDDLAVVDLGAEGVAVVADGGLAVVDGDGHVVDLGEQHGASSAQPARRKRVILSSPTRSRSSGSSMPGPSSMARQSTPIWPSWRLR